MFYIIINAYAVARFKCTAKVCVYVCVGGDFTRGDGTGGMLFFFLKGSIQWGVGGGGGGGGKDFLAASPTP